MSAQHKVIHLHQRAPQEALERLNRITGLCFSSWPESLAPQPAPEACSERPLASEGGCAAAKLSAS